MCPWAVLLGIFCKLQLGRNRRDFWKLQSRLQSVATPFNFPLVPVVELLHFVYCTSQLTEGKLLFECKCLSFQETRRPSLNPEFSIVARNRANKRTVPVVTAESEVGGESICHTRRKSMRNHERCSAGTQFLSPICRSNFYRLFLFSCRYFCVCVCVLVVSGRWGMFGDWRTDCGFGGFCFLFNKL